MDIKNLKNMLIAERIKLKLESSINEASREKTINDRIPAPEDKTSKMPYDRSTSPAVAQVNNIPKGMGNAADFNVKPGKPWTSNDEAGIRNQQKQNITTVGAVPGVRKIVSPDDNTAIVAPPDGSGSAAAPQRSGHTITSPDDYYRGVLRAFNTIETELLFASTTLPPEIRRHVEQILTNLLNSELTKIKDKWPDTNMAGVA